MPVKDESYATRSSLLSRLKDWADADGWQEFNAIYGPLIFRFALKAGCTESEAQEVVQETLVAAARHLPAFQYDPAVCAFKTWLLNLSHWRVQDQLRKRLPSAVSKVDEEPDQRTATIERIPDPKGNHLQRIWDQEWKALMLETAVANIKLKVPPKQWQIFDLYVLKGEAPRQVAQLLSVSIGRVYLIKHRVGGVLKKELTRLNRETGV
jgi:RNA polymerase sigma factor (sigma-70 family)